MLKKVPQQARSRQMVDFILEGAARVLNTAPLAETTTNRIAEVAGVGIGSLYQYFDDKEAIALSLLQQHLKESAALVRNTRLVSGGCPVSERLRLLFTECLRDHRDKRMLHLNLIDVCGAVPSAARFDPSIGTMVDDISAILREHRPEAHSDHIRLCATSLHQSVVMLVHAAISRPNLERDGTIIGHFEALDAANRQALDLHLRQDRRAAAS